MSSTALARSTSQQSLARSTTTSTDSLPILNLTPRRQAPLPPTPSPRTPNAAHSTPNTTSGWLHPRMDEVIRRKNATNFDTRNMQAVLYSGLVLAFSFFVPHMLSGAIPLLWQQYLSPYPFYILWTARFLVLANAAFACKPLLLSQDACEDVPLTPQQRKLLGLPPMTRPATPQEKGQYVTPPRFSRSATPRSASGSSIKGGQSPPSGRNTPLADGNGSFSMSGGGGGGGGSPFANSTAGSPFPARGKEARRRLSYTGNRSSPLTASEFEAMGNLSPSGGAGRKENRASVGLNNKWLYEKGRRGSGGGGGGGAPAGRMGIPQTPGGGRMPGIAGLY